MEKKEKNRKPLSSKTVSFIMMGVALLVFILGYIFYVKPAADLAAELNQQDIQALELEMTNKQGRLLAISKLAKSYEDPSAEALDKLYEALPKEPNEVDLMANLNSIIVQSGLEVKGIDISVPEIKEIPLALQKTGLSGEETGVKEINITLGIDGMSYTNLKRFIRNVETNSRLLKLELLNINPSSSSYNVNLKAFYLESKQEG